MTEQTPDAPGEVRQRLTGEFATLGSWVCVCGSSNNMRESVCYGCKRPVRWPVNDAPGGERAQDEPMTSCSSMGSDDAVQGLLRLVRAEQPVVDVTWGNGTFWRAAPYHVFGFDCLYDRAQHVVADFKALPIRDGGVPTIVFDPPFHPAGANSAESGRFQTMGKTEVGLREQFKTGLAECWRATSRHLIVKCQGFIHNHQPQWMPLWAIDVCGEPFEWLIVSRGHKRVSGRWINVKSLRRNHADYLVFDKRGNKR